ncbi:hypothetical protein [Streptomyces sp. H27-D2]|uniref:hypothetical protein n=1 Tax=Streptomyces sp. H27-D2 TaxID=3046304 RepID=UPI002DBB7501|nr:hypothetical protein [Streptomyces sp. H27-D2]MEC4020656.1 hypothetical protein [Streptomyces sp. H27-D2]
MPVTHPYRRTGMSQGRPGALESDAERKRTGLLALGLLGFLLIAVLTVFTVFDDDEEPESTGSDKPAATARADDGSAGSSDTGGDSAAEEKAGLAPIVPLSDVAEAHDVMTAYMAGVNTYDHSTVAGPWVKPLLEMTTGETVMKQETALPTGKEWANCLAAKCTSKGRAVVERDALISDDVARGSGETISSVVEVSSTRTEGGKKTTETNSWLVSVKRSGSQWQVSGFDLFGLGNVGASDQTGE